MARDYALDLLRLNQSRVLAGTGSPKILVGGINLNSIPNFHTLPMIEMGASLVGLTIEPEHCWRPDMLYAPPSQPLLASMKRLPQKWDPDFFWDSQVEHGHYIPPGLSAVPIPSIVSFNHAHLGQALWHMQGMFDAIIAPSAFVARWGTEVAPWGCSWGALDDRIGKAPEVERDIDFACTVSGGKLGKESIRHRVVEVVQRMKREFTDMKIEIAYGLSQADYYALLRRSKTALNVGTWGAQMSYRPLEIISCGARLIHIDETGYGSKATLAEYLDTATIATPETLATRVWMSKDFDAWKAIAAAQRREVAEKYTYRKQYKRLFEIAGRTKAGPRLSEQDFSRHAFAVNHTTGFPAEASVHGWALTEADRRTLQEVPEVFPDVCLWKPKDEERLARFRTDIARQDVPTAETYRKHYLDEQP